MIIAVFVLAVLLTLAGAYLIFLWSYTQSQWYEITLLRGKVERLATDGLTKDRRIRLLTARSSDLALALSPLLEKTDWMTGRWAGQFGTLQRLEKQRNAYVDHARRALTELPQVQDIVKTNPTALFPNMNGVSL